MVAIVRTEWSGASGGPGLTQLAMQGAAGGDWNPAGTQAAVNAVRTFWNSLTGYLPDELKLQVMPVIDVYDDATGELRSSYAAGTVPLVVVGTSTFGYAGGSGCKVTWNTGQIRNGRRIRGSTFIVPITGAAFGNTGTTLQATQTAINTSAAALISQLVQASTPLAVWSRPRDLPTPRSGFSTEVKTGTCSMKSAILRGRRD